jgi:hypothetical protein
MLAASGMFTVRYPKALTLEQRGEVDKIIQQTLSVLESRLADYLHDSRVQLAAEWSITGLRGASRTEASLVVD